ncbi:MAG TPA: GWxTD domain-containing protein [Terracidiphilus sp.]|nr:GWxTD domain-containing protein [Terracidiphilus sp.]
MSRIRFTTLALLLCSLFFALPGYASNSIKSLSPHYRHWIEAEVPYIITSDERKQFLSLTTDEQRESFITAFWRARNPDPGSEVNSFKEEHYRRLTYANEHFGSPGYDDGWRTEMGRMYIVLGAPKQRAVYSEQANLRPMEIWFYESDLPALPPHFYILFFKHSGAESWQVYSPRMDGPVALVTTGESQNDSKMALRFIRGSAGDEVAKTTLTLIPGEAVDFNNPAPGMESDVLLDTIRGLADNPLMKQRLEANRLREHVTASVFAGGDEMSFGYDVVDDEKGRDTLSYLLEMVHPDSRLVGRLQDGGLGYDLELRTTVATADGKPMYEQDDQLSGKLTEAQAAVAKRKRFAAEARLPVVPGTYLLDIRLTNNLNHIGSRKRATVTVTGEGTGDLALSPLLAYVASPAVPDRKGQLPFSISHLRFTPHGVQTVELPQGAHLPLAFQLRLSQNSAQPAASNKVQLRYVFGAVTASHETPADEHEEIDASNHDKAGNLLTGHTIDTSALTPGTYRVVVSATREGSHRPAYSAINLKVIPAADFIGTWTAYGPADPGGEAVDDLKRGFAAEALGAYSQAQDFYASALREGSADMRPLDQLASLFSRRGNTDDLAKLSQQPILMQAAASPKTLLSISQALKERNNSKEIVRVLEAQIKLQPPNVDLYHALADACEATGNLGRARELRDMARQSQ